MSKPLHEQFEALLKSRYAHWSSSMRLEMRDIMHSTRHLPMSKRHQLIREHEREIEERHFAKLVA